MLYATTCLPATPPSMAAMKQLLFWIAFVLFFASGFAVNSEEDLAAAFPTNLSAVLKRVADAKCIPYRAMISGMIMLVCAFSPASWCSSVGGHNEPLMMFLKNLGLSGINKTGAMRFFEHIFFATRTALVAMSNNAALCIKNDLRVMKGCIPEAEYTATQAALIQKFSRSSNLVGLFDEHATMMRQLTNGSNGGAAEGSQTHLTVYNGPSSTTNELKSGVEKTFEPRYTTLTGIQPAVAKADFGAGTTLFNIGMSSRSLWFSLESNLPGDHLPAPLTRDEQTVLDFALAIAAPSFLVPGKWKANEDPVAIELAFTGVNGATLHSTEVEALEFIKHTFIPDDLGESAALIASQIAEVNRMKVKNSFECTKAMNKGDLPPGRCLVNLEVCQEDNGEGPFLPISMHNKQIDKMRVFYFCEGSEAEAAMQERILAGQKEFSRMSETDPRKVLIGKEAGQLARLVGIFQVIQNASEDVETFLGNKPLHSQVERTAFMIDIMNARRQFQPSGGGTFRNWAIGSDRESRLPECFFEQITLVSVKRADRILASSRETAESTLFDIHPRPIVDHATSGTTSLAAAEQVAPGCSSRGHELMKQAILKQFLFATLTSVLPGLRIRSSVKGACAGNSELPLLFEIQSGPFLAVIVRGSQLSKKFFLKKMVLTGLSQKKKLEACKYLSEMGLTLDQYSANAKMSSLDADFDSIGPDYPEGPLPYGLVRSDIPNIFESELEEAIGASDVPAQEMPFSILQPPPLTQQRLVTMNDGSDDDEKENDADLNKRPRIDKK